MNHISYDYFLIEVSEEGSIVIEQVSRSDVNPLKSDLELNLVYKEGSSRIWTTSNFKTLLTENKSLKEDVLKILKRVEV